MASLRLDNEVKENASIADISSAIRELDSAVRSLVLIELTSGLTLSIGGGPDRFVAELSESDTERWCVVDQSRGEGAIEMVVGGQLADFPARVCVDLELVLEAAQTFISSEGGKSSKVTWSQET